MIRPPGSIERVPHNNFTFKAPLQQMIKDRVIKRIGPRRYRSISSEPIRIEMMGTLEIVLTEGTEFYSITWESESELHNCRIDFSTRD